MLLLAITFCLSFALPAFARHHHHYYYDNGFGGTFRTRTWYPDCFAAYLGIVGGAIPVFDATKLAENIKILAEFEKITSSIQDLFGLRKQRLASTLDMEVENLAKVKLPETAPDKESRQPGILYSGETVLAPEIKPEDTVLNMRIDHFDALTIPTDIGYGMSLHSTMAMDDHMATTRATMDAMEIRNYYLLDLNCKGEYNGTFRKYLEDRDMMPEIYPGDMEAMKENKPDFLAFNYYYSQSVSAYPLDDEHEIGDIEFKLLPNKEAGIYQVVKNENLKATLWGWEIDEIGLQCSARLLYERYGLPLLITECGFGNKEVWPQDGIIEDDDRIDYLSRHIHAVKEAMNLGVEFIGFCSWSFIDLISGHSGFSKRYGFVYVNRDEHDLKDLARRKKKSFSWYKDTIACNGRNI